MRTVILGGSLGARFGTDPFTLDVRTPQEAAVALGHMLKGFRQAVLDCASGVHVIVGGEYRGDDDVGQPCARVETIEIIPAIAGSSAAARVVAGVVLMVVGAYTSWSGGGLLISMGAALAFGGAAEMLSPKPKTSDSTSETQSGYSFSGGVNTTGQGIAVRRAYGKGMSGTHIISGQILTESGVFYAADELHPVVGGDTGTENLNGFADTVSEWGADDNDSGFGGDSAGYSIGGDNGTVGGYCGGDDNSAGGESASGNMA